VEYDEFIDRVAERAGVSREQADMLTKATLMVLADRLSGGQAMDLAAHLPEQLGRRLRESPQKPAEGYGFDAFVWRVRRLVPEIPEQAVRPGIRAVMLTLREAVPDKEFQDTLDQLPREFRDLLKEEREPQAAQAQATATTAGAQSTDAAAQEDTVVQRTAERTGVSAQEAAQLTQATLEVLGDRIGGQQAHDLAQRLPDTSGQWLDEPPETPAHDYGVDDFIGRVRDRAPDVRDDVGPGIRAVIIALRDAVGEAELEIALRPLSDDYDVLVRAG
jgi:uncharacterized protein (DUF2267 family)